MSRMSSDGVLEMCRRHGATVERFDNGCAVRFTRRVHDRDTAKSLVRLLPDIHGLKGLALHGLILEDCDMNHIARCADLRRLGLGDAPHLGVSRREITDGAMPALARLPGLVALYLGGCSVTDRGIRWCAQMATLRELYLSDTLVTVNGLRALAGIGLHILDIRGTNTDEKDREELQALLPDAQVVGMS